VRPHRQPVRSADPAVACWGDTTSEHRILPTAAVETDEVRGVRAVGQRSKVLEGAGDAFAWSLLDASPDGVLIVSTDGEICFANDRAAALFSWPADELAGTSVDQLVPPELRGRHRAHRTRYRADPVVRTIGGGGDLRARRRDGRGFDAEISLSPLTIDGDDFAVVTVRDVSDRTAAEEHIHRVLHTLDASDEAILFFDAESLAISYVNEGAQRMFGYTAEELTEMTPLHLDPLATGDRYRDLADRLTAAPTERVRQRARILRRDGAEVPVEHLFQAGPPSGDGARWIVCLTNDISERLEREAELEAGRARMRAADRAMVQIDERTRIARELHDTVIQRLFAAGLGLQAVLPSAEPLLAEQLDATVSELDATIADLRTAIHALRHPPRVDPLRDRLLAIVTQVEVAGIHAIVELHGTLEQLDEHVVAHLVPTLREALANVTRHAHASVVEVTLDVTAGWLDLCIDDDGVGPLDRSRGGYGLVNLAGRAELLGGTSTLLPRPGGGSTFTWRVPLDLVRDDVGTAGDHPASSVDRGTGPAFPGAAGAGETAM
jgi:PAS domain S-box-containing protein